MSMKVYNAYKLKRGTNIGTFMQQVFKHAHKRSEEILQSEIWAWGFRARTLPDFDNKVQKTQEDHGFSQEDADKVVQHRYGSKLMNEGYKESSLQGIRSPFNYDASVTFRYYKGCWYIQIFADGAMKDVFDFVTSHPKVSDYEYQNQTDRNEGVTEEDWAEREQVWDGLYKTDQDRKTFLSLTIMDFKEFEYWDVAVAWDYMDSIRAKYAKKEKNGKRK